MPYFLLILIVLLAGCQQNAPLDGVSQGGQDNAYSLKIDRISGASAGYGRTETTELRTWLSEGDFSNQPKWRLSVPDPPLSANAAMVAASMSVDSLVNAGNFPDGSCIDEIRLCPFDPDLGDWYYVVDFAFNFAGGFHPQLSVAVLMDGTVPQLEISDRTDIGWPLPNRDSPDRPNGLSDTDIVNTFIDRLNPDRLYAGQIVEITGELKKLESGHPHLECGQPYCIVLDSGKTLLYDPANPYHDLSGVSVTVTGELIGYRNRFDSYKDWQNIALVPGIRKRDAQDD